MRASSIVPLCCLVLAGLAPLSLAETGGLQVPQSVEAGRPFSIATGGSGSAILYIVGPLQVLRRTVQLGERIVFNSGEIHNAGHYLAILVADSSTKKAEFDVIAANQTASLSFLARPARLPVDVPDGISGVVYVFDVFGNLQLEPAQVSFQLSEDGRSIQTRTETTRNGVAWAKMNSSPKAGVARFQARAGSVTAERVIQQVGGDPCNLTVRAQRLGENILLETAPIHDCKGNPVSDGTIVTFTETAKDGSAATVDVPVKRGVAKIDMPIYSGAVISSASGLVMGNEVRLGDTR